MKAPMDGETTELLRSAHRGDQVAVEDLLRRLLPELRTWVRLRMSPVLRAREESSDIVQSVCREVLADLDHEPEMDENTLRAWLFTAVRRKVVDKTRFWLREQRDVRRTTLAVDGSSDPHAHALAGISIVHPSQRVVDRELHHMMEGWFDRLSAEEQEAIALCNVLRLPIRQAAAQSGVSEDAMRQRVSRARRKLWQMYRSWDQERDRTPPPALE